MNEKAELTEQLIYLCRCAVDGIKPEKERLEGIDPEALYALAERHLLTSAAGMALESARIRNEAFMQAVARTQRKNALLDADRARVLGEMEKARIWYMPLKGSVLKDLYPRYGMRQMADNDILFDVSRAEDVKDIMIRLGFSCEHFDEGNHDVYYKAPVSNFEMHRGLFAVTGKDLLYRYYSDVKKRLIRDDGREYGYHFSNEDFYIYMISHEYKHYSGGGTGLRSLMDTYVYLKRKQPDMEYVRQETEKLGISGYEAQNRKLALDLFGGKKLDSEEQEMLDYMLSSGTYGTMANAVSNQIREKGRMGFFLSRMSLPMEMMKTIYPAMRKAPWLYPVFWVWRLISRYFTNHRKFMYELKRALGIGGKGKP